MVWLASKCLRWQEYRSEQSVDPFVIPRSKAGFKGASPRTRQTVAISKDFRKQPE